MTGSPPTGDLVADRYGRREPVRTRWSRRRWWIVAAVGVVLGVAWAGWASSRYAQPPVSAQVRGYDVVSGTSTRVELEVVRRDGAAAVCEVYAVARDHAIVGERRLDVPAGDPGTVRVGTEIRTERRAVTGTLRSCRPAD